MQLPLNPARGGLQLHVLRRHQLGRAFRRRHPHHSSGPHPGVLGATVHRPRFNLRRAEGIMHGLS